MLTARRIKHQHLGRALSRLMAVKAWEDGYARAAAEPGYWPDDDHWDDDDRPTDLTCKHCSGTGGDPWNDGITPCEHCDGEGYEWWN